MIAQNWLDLSAERGLSSFDQRHLLNVRLQYTTGMGLHGGTLLSGWRGALFKEWTVLYHDHRRQRLASDAGLSGARFREPAAPAVSARITPERHLYAPPAGLFLNPAAYIAPLPGQLGNAGRDSITGPDQFSLNASMARTFRLNDRLNLDLRVDSTNALNHVTFPSWNTIVGSPQFGLADCRQWNANVQTTLRVRF